jgi:hypothetical protein
MPVHVDAERVTRVGTVDAAPPAAGESLDPVDVVTADDPEGAFGNERPPDGMLMYRPGIDICACCTRLQSTGSRHTIHGDDIDITPLLPPRLS